MDSFNQHIGRYQAQVPRRVSNGRRIVSYAQGNPGPLGGASGDPVNEAEFAQ